MRWSRWQVWVAEAKVESDKKEEQERQLTLQKEKDLAETESLFRKGGVAGAGRSVSFMYEPPPGLAAAQEKEALARAAEARAAAVAAAAAVSA